MPTLSGKVFTLSWKIVNYSLCQLKNVERLKSAVISTEDFQDTKWYLRLYPKGVNNKDVGFISCFLIRNEECEKNENGFPTSCTLEILNPNGKILASMEKKSLSERGSGLYRFLSRGKLEHDMKSWKTDMLEVRCQLFDQNYKQQSVTCEAVTEIQKKKHSFDWKITVPVMQDWVKKVKCPIEEQYPINISLTASDGKIYLKFEKSREQSLTELWKLKISILNLEGIEIDLKNSTHIFKSSEFETSFEKNQLEDKSDVCSTCSFKLVCTIYISDGTSTSTFVNYSYEIDTCVGLGPLDIPQLPLQKDLKKMLLEREHTDLNLHAGKEMIPVHKCLLSARSPVFSAMFKRDMKENQTGVVDIPDVESEVLRSFVEYLYTDIFSNTEFEHVLNLLLVADKYQVNSLKERCSKILISKISTENIYEVISVADLVNQVALKQLALNYIKTNKMAIIQSPDWSDWVERNMKLAIEILTKLSID
ncbi:speckle-type POZ protein B-like [Parasteatoda tepidariorum]|uniref:speckle-type POZ protein B-like n=1 Tax=Parasteatoda tepidariorum TaxID=114398 RepID=UPI0039BCD859